jgi:hypothetical protein
VLRFLTPSIIAAGLAAVTTAGASASPFVSVHAPATATTGAPIDVTYHGMSDDAQATLTSYYELGLTACPATSSAARSGAGSRHDIYEHPPAGPFDYGSQIQVADPGAYLLCVYLDGDDAGTAPPLATTQTAFRASGSAAPTPDPTPTPSCVVPNVVGRKLARAKRALIAAHCRTGAVVHRRRHHAGRVLSQSPQPGATRGAGSAVRLTVAR